MPSNLGSEPLADWLDWDKGLHKPSQSEPSDEVRTQLEEFLSILTELQREVYVMRVASQMSFASIGLILNKSPQVCRVHYTLADEKIRLRLRRMKSQLDEPVAICYAPRQEKGPTWLAS